MGQTAASGLTVQDRPVGGRTRRLRFALAESSDTADINRLLRDTRIPGWITLSYEREPDYRIAAATEGDVHETLLGRDLQTGELVVMGSFSIQEVWLNGEPCRVGYLSQLRVDPSYRSRVWPVLEGHRFIRELVDRRPDVEHVLASIVSSNTRAVRLLSSGCRDMPAYLPVCGFWTIAFASCRGRGKVGGIEISRGGTTDLPGIASFLDDQHRRFQFAPRWTADRMASDRRSPGLCAGDFLIARRSGRVIGCVALWDQSAFKQYIVRGYAPWIDRLRSLINLSAPALGLPRLPAPGSPLRQLSLSHLAVENDDPVVLRVLLSEALNQAAARGLPIAVMGLGDGHPLLATARSVSRHMAYRSDIYLVDWGNDNLHVALDGRPPQPEVAIL